MNREPLGRVQFDSQPKLYALSGRDDFRMLNVCFWISTGVMWAAEYEVHGRSRTVAHKVTVVLFLDSTTVQRTYALGLRCLITHPRCALRRRGSLLQANLVSNGCP